MRVFHPIEHYLTARPRLLLSIGAGVACYGLLPSHFSILLRLMIAWNALAWLYLIFLWWEMLRAEPEDIRTIALRQDESASTVLTLVTLTCLMSILVILLELSNLKQISGADKAWHLVLTGLTLVVSWSLLPTSFAMHYAHLFYRDHNPHARALIFPNNVKKPYYWDFLYFSFTIAVASQTADVATGTTEVRKVALLQSVISFVFNLAILGLSINVGAGLLS
ncbi:DUF1345 domain-containing protein [Acerihabitans sp. TG2]|uniref:DUF1345 domain-containing protein n=1 Tax=Acerihabitans sp. TG2 TaxID=3096008 RepID=UPI002B224C02|nr:DUF1345 domain-containing protein [Acerihabitans sp. TG2]MEA9390562.1 DUF1345 domain-containing protein [Acerihabitans sp. TG2]